MSAATAPAPVRWRTLLWLPVVAAGALVLAWLLLDPGRGDLVTLGVVFGALALATALAVPAVARWVAGRRRVANAVLLVSLSAVATTMVAAVVAAQLMFLSTHDLRLLAAVLVLAGGLAAVLAVSVAAPLAADARRLRDAAARVALGDLSARSGIDRADEMGDAARAFDDMVARLATAEHDRRRLEAERRLLLTSISHDLRTPLAALRAAVEALQDGVAPDPPRTLDAMAHDVTALTALIDDLHLHARLEAGRFEHEVADVDLTELADEAIEAIGPLAHSAGVRLGLGAPGRLHVQGDSAALGRVVRNLLDNAVRHAPPGGRVAVELGQQGGEVVLLVTDDGPGFPPGFRDEAFEPFTRADEARSRATGSSGLGLAIARGIVEAHGGVIGVPDGPGGRVEVRLPASR